MYRQSGASDESIAMANVDVRHRTHAKVFVEDGVMSGMRLVYDSSAAGRS